MDVTAKALSVQALLMLAASVRVFGPHIPYLPLTV